MKTILGLLGLLLLLVPACGGEAAAPPIEGVSPDAQLPSAQAAEAPLVLEAPTEPAPEPEETPAPPAGPPPKISFEIGDLGRFEVITWAEAERLAAAKVGPDTFQTEANRLRAEILGRRR